LGEKIILYDLTNTYLTGRAHASSLGQRGHAKENEQGERLYPRQTTDPEPFHLEIYRALNLAPKPLKTKRFKV
jgi:hypothetical protein